MIPYILTEHQHHYIVQKYLSHHWDAPRLDRRRSLNLSHREITVLPDSIGNLTNLTELILNSNQIKRIPESIGNLSGLTSLNLDTNQLEYIPESIVNLVGLTELILSGNQLYGLPDNIGNLTNLKGMGNLINLEKIHLSYNHLTSLPKSLSNLSELQFLNIQGNPLSDLSMLHALPSLEHLNFLVFNLPRRYWTKFSDWKPKRLLVENNAEIRRVLIEQVGYEKICEELNAVTLDTWQEYTLLKIDDIEKIYDGADEPIDTEPMVLLKMTCPSTAHIHILRVPPGHCAAMG